MAEGFDDFFEMTDMGEKYPEYDAMDNEALLKEQRRIDELDELDSPERYDYITNLIDKRGINDNEEETSFCEAVEKRKEEEKEIYRDLINFIEKEYNVKVNRNTGSWNELKNRVVFTDKNKIRFPRRLKNNKYTKQQLNRIPIVLKSVEVMILNLTKLLQIKSLSNSSNFF